MSAQHAMFTNEALYDPANGGYKVGLAERDVPGWTLVNTGWKTLTDAQDYVAEMNTHMGVSAGQAIDILSSSMAAGPLLTGK